VLPLRGLPPFDEYYALRAWERDGRVFHWLGVPLFRALVRRGPLSLPNRALPAAWQSGDPARIERETRAAEGGHAIAFMIVIALSVVSLVRGAPARAAWHRHRLQVMLRTGELVPGGDVPQGRRNDIPD